jgi:hypothetical protein
MQVLVLDPPLIPTSVDAVIGDNVYELRFKVEPDEMSDSPGILDMEDDSDEFDGLDEADDGKDVQGDFMQEDIGGNSKGKSVELMPSKNSNTEHQEGSKKSIIQKTIQGAHGVDEIMQVDVSDDEMLEELSHNERSGGDHFDILDSEVTEPDSVCMNLDNESPNVRSAVVQQENVEGATHTHIPSTDDGRFLVVLQENVDGATSVHGPAQTVAEVHRDFAAILEASTPSCKSKWRAQSTDEHSLDRAEQIKAAHNLDFNKANGNNNKTHSSFIHLSNDFVTKNLQSIGILLGNYSDQINISVE